MKQIKQRIGALLLLGTVLALIFAPCAVYADISAPSGETQIAVPVSVAANGVVAGCEIEFTATSGLEYKGFAVTPAFQTTGFKIDTKVNGKNYFGFFADENLFATVNGSLTVGSLVFAYSGNDPQEVTFSDVRVHTKSGDGNVSTDKTNPNTVVRIVRAGGESNSGNENPSGNDGDTGNENAGGNTPGNSGVGTPGNNATSGNGTTNGSGSTTTLVSLQSAGSAPRNVIETDADDLLADEETIADASVPETLGTESDTKTLIEEENVPLANAEAGQNNLLYILIAAVIVCALLLFFIIARRRKKSRTE